VGSSEQTQSVTNPQAHSFDDRGESNRMSLSFQQALADFVFQCLDLPAQGGLRQENPFAAPLMLPPSATATK
jgi:hypothetical protein